MVKLTAAQTKKLKLHAINQSAGHMKKMIALMKAGESFSEAHAAASKKSVKQKQSQKQSQKVVINLAAPRRRRPASPRVPTAVACSSSSSNPSRCCPSAPYSPRPFRNN